MKLNVLISKEEQLKGSFAGKVSRVYLEAEAVNPSRFPEIVHDFAAEQIEVFLALPRIMTPEAKWYLEKAAESVKKAGFTGFLARSLESFGVMQSLGISGKFVADYGLYAFNSESRKVLYDFGFSHVTVPPELNGKEISEVGFSGDELTVYGRYPMMITRNCIHKTLEGCDRKANERILTDRMKNRMPVENHCAYCLNLIYNSLPTDLILHKDEIRRLPIGAVRLEFTDESISQVRETVSVFYETLLGNKAPEKPKFPYTNGHFTRGVD